MVHLKSENSDPKRDQYLFSQPIHVPDRAPNLHRKTGSVRLTSHEASPMELENGQHHSGCLHKQGGRYEIRLSLCPPLETALLVQSQANSGQIVQELTGDPGRVVPSTGGVPPPMCKMPLLRWISLPPDSTTSFTGLCLQFRIRRLVGWMR